MGDMDTNNTDLENMDTVNNSTPDSESSQDNVTQDTSQELPMDTTDNGDIQPDNDNLKSESDENTGADPAVNLVDSLLETVTIPVEPEKKRLNKALIAVLIIIGILLAGSITAFANRNAIVNTLSMMTKSPAEYYAYIEQQGMEKGIDKLTSSYDNWLTQYDKMFKSGNSQDLNMKLTINPQFTGMLGLSNFESVEAKISALSKEGNSKSSLGLFYNEKSLMTLNSFMNAETSDLYLMIPELSSAYLLFSMDELMQESGTYSEDFSYSEYLNGIQSFVENESLSPEVLNSLLDKYSALVIKHIDDVTLDKNIALTASEISSEYSRLTATITQEDAYAIASDILTEAKEDQALIDLCKTLEICTEEEYSTAIDQAISDLESSKETMSSSDDTIEMYVYVDKNGTIMGREFKSTDDELASSLGYYITNKGKEIGYTAWYSENDTKLFDFTGKSTYNNNTYNGDADIKLSVYDEYYGDYTNYAFHVAYENADVIDDMGHTNGKYTITSDLLSGVSIILDCTADSKQQKVALQILYGNIEAGTLEILQKEGTFQDFEMPSESDEVYNAIDDYTSYFATADFESFISNLETVLEIEDLDSYFNAIMSSFMYQ